MMTKIFLFPVPIVLSVFALTGCKDRNGERNSPTTTSGPGETGGGGPSSGSGAGSAPATNSAPGTNSAPSSGTGT
jgi:hypothetical protein